VSAQWLRFDLAAIKVVEVDHYDAIVARTPSLRAGVSASIRSSFDSVNSLYLNTKGMFLAGIRSRQRRRPSSAGTQEENAARRCFSRDEAQKILREAVRKIEPGTS
jgi:hypothetical protein